MKALLLRVGIDRGCGGALAPIFQDGTFEFIPIPEDQGAQRLTYGAARCRWRRREAPSGTLADYLPTKLAGTKLHADPDFEHGTYGDPTGKKPVLLRLEPADLLVFYAGLTPRGFRDEDALYIIGYFEVEQVMDLGSLEENELNAVCDQYPDNADIVGGYLDAALVVARPGRYRLLDRAIRISERRPDRGGHPTHALRPDVATRLGISGFIQRSMPPRWIRGREHLDELQQMLGLTRGG